MKKKDEEEDVQSKERGRQNKQSKIIEGRKQGRKKGRKGGRKEGRNH